MPDGELKTRLASYSGPITRRRSVIAHRGAPLGYPEHTIEAHDAGLRQGAGVIEADVAFTKDFELVVRHGFADLERDTDALAQLAAGTATFTPSVPFSPCVPAGVDADGNATEEVPATAQVRTTDMTLREFQRLRGTNYGKANPKAQDHTEYKDVAPWKKELLQFGQVLSFRQFLERYKHVPGIRFTPELKQPQPADYEAVRQSGAVGAGLTDQEIQDAFCDKLIHTIKDAGIPPQDIILQSFIFSDIKYWIDHHPAFGANAAFLTMPESVCESITDAGTPSAKLLADDPSYLAKLKAQGLRIIAPSMNDLYKGTEHGPVRSAWAEAATEAGLRIITWTLERSPPGDAAAAWYWRADGKGEGSNVYSDTVIDKLSLLHTLFTVVGIEAIFSDVSAAAPFASSFRSSKQRLHSGRRLYRCERL